MRTMSSNQTTKNTYRNAGVKLHGAKRIVYVFSVMGLLDAYVQRMQVASDAMTSPAVDAL